MVEAILSQLLQYLPQTIIAFVLYSYIPAFLLVSIFTKDNSVRIILAMVAAFFLSFINGLIITEIFRAAFTPTNAFIFGFFEALIIWIQREEIKSKF